MQAHRINFNYERDYCIWYADFCMSCDSKTSENNNMMEEELQEGMGYDLEEELQENRTFLSKSSCETVESPTKHLRKLTVINVIGALNQFNNRYEI